MKRFFILLVCLLAAQSFGQDLVKPVPLDKVNTPADEDDPFITQDGLTLLYAVKGVETWKVFAAQRASLTKPFLVGKPWPGLAGKEADFRSPFFSAGKLYFASNEIPDEKFKDKKNFDLKQKMGNRAPLPLLGVSEPEDELHPWVAAGGKEFYFSRKTKEGWLLFVARGPNPGPIGDAKPAGLPPGFHHATLSSTGLTMYLQGPLEKDRWGIFRAKRAKIGAAWSKPEPIVNLTHPEAPRGDLSPCLSGDGLRLYFASDRPGGKGGLDIWSVPTAQLKTAGK